MLSNIRFSFRRLGRRPAFSFLVVLMLALGIGSTASIFSVVEAVLLRPLPYRDSERLVSVWQTYPQWRNQEVLHTWWDNIPLSYPEYLDWREAQTVFEEVALCGGRTAAMTGRDQPRLVEIGLATHTFFPLLGEEPLLGRLFSAEDDRPGAPSVALLEHDFWRSALGGDPAVVGTSLKLGNRLYAVIGILRPRFQFNRQRAAGTQADVWVPLANSGSWVQERDNRSFEALALLNPGVKLEDAQLETASILRGNADPSEKGARLVRQLDQLTQPVRTPLLILLASSALLLLIACANAAGLLLGEAVDRQREIAIRSHLGATPARILGQLLSESLLLGVLAGSAGIVLASWGNSSLLSLVPDELPRLDQVALDWRVLAFALLLSLATGIVSGLAPAVALLRPSRLTAMPTRAGSAGWQPSRLQPALVVGQITLCFVLLTAAALLSQSWVNLIKVDPGFTTQKMLTFELSLPSSYENPSAFYGQLLERLEGLPGVISAGAVSHLPLTGTRQSNSIEVGGSVRQAGVPSPESERREVYPGYFRTAGIPLLKGRLFDRRDRADSPPATIVNQTLARRLWPNRSALDREILFRGRPLTVIGVVGDIHHSGLDQIPLSMFYLSQTQFPRRQMVVVVRTDRDPLSLTTAVRQEVWKLDSNLPVTKVDSIEGVLTQWLAWRRYRTILADIFAALACSIAFFGVFSVTSRSVRRSRRELGIRIAMGANRRRILSLVVRRSLSVTLFGVMLGCAASWSLSRYLSGLLYAVEGTDVATYLAVAAFITCASLASGYLPARKAAKLDPAATLKAE